MGKTQIIFEIIMSKGKKCQRLLKSIKTVHYVEILKIAPPWRKTSKHAQSLYADGFQVEQSIRIRAPKPRRSYL